MAWIYYGRSSKELVAETSKLRRSLDLMIRGMEQEGWITGVKRDSQGAIVSWEQKVGVSSIESKETFGHPNLTVKNISE